MNLTIIIPCYNNSKFLSKCLDSILNSTYKDYNLILIDDCSKDDSLKIMNQYKKKFDNIEIITNSKNSGAGYCRNKALKLCKTKYVTFIDSDDYIEKDYLKILMKQIKNYDVIVADIKIQFPDKDILAPCCEGKLTKENLINNGYAASPCNKIFKTDLIKQYPFAEGIMNEDICTVVSCLINGNVNYTSDTHYNYVQHKTSVQHSNLTTRRLDIFKSLVILKKYNKNINKDIWDSIVFNQIILFLFYVISGEKSIIKRAGFLKKFSKEFSNVYDKDNQALNAFLKNQSKLHKLYYKMQVFLCNKHCNFTLSILISSYKFYKKYFTKNVLEKKYNLDMLENAAQLNQNLKQKKELTAVIPNYNYSKFIYQRLYSILNQQYKIKKIIILDDASTDNSVEIINQIIKRINKYIDIEFIVNDINSGSAFKQWQKGIELVSTEYLWIAEADDYCDKKFLKKVFSVINDNKNISIAYVNTAFINSEGLMIRRSVIPDVDIQNSGHWNQNYINNGLDELKKYSYLNCTIANVSSAVFKTENAKKCIDVFKNYKQVGDWAFYNKMMTLGDVAFIKDNINYYRVHGNNATTLNKKQLHFDEIVKIHQNLEKQLHFTQKHKKLIDERYDFLEKVWGIDRRK